MSENEKRSLQSTPASMSLALKATRNLIAFYVISGECDEQYANGHWKYDEDTSFILHRFCVAPKVQNRGLGKEILIHIEKQIKDMGYLSVRLDVFT